MLMLFIKKIKLLLRGVKTIFYYTCKKNVHVQMLDKYSITHMLFVHMKNGTVYVWGHPDWGGTNIDDVKSLEDIVQIIPVFAGFVIDKNNKLFSWGTSYRRKPLIIMKN